MTETDQEFGIAHPQSLVEPAHGVERSSADDDRGGQETESSFDQAAFVTSPHVPVALEAGVQTIRLTFSGTPAGSGYLLDLRSLTLVAPSDPVPDSQTPFGGAAPQIGEDP